MRLSIVIAILNFSVCLAYVHSPVYDTICKRSGGSITCYQDNTWAFDETTDTCYNVLKNIEPCGFFDGQKGCQDFCLNSLEYQRRPDYLKHTTTDFPDYDIPYQESKLH